MNDTGNRYALAALKNKRAHLASEIVQAERHLRHLRESLVHVDATLALLDPSISPESIPNARPRKRVKLFRQGELGRMIVDALRNASGTPMTVQEITSVVLAAGGHGEEARPALMPRVRGNLAYLKSRGTVFRVKFVRDAAWRLT